MTRIGFLGMAALLCCSAFAQPGRPDFSGTWKLDKNKSATWKLEGTKTTRDDAQDGDYVEIIQQSGTNITIATKAEGLTNSLDGTYAINGKQQIKTVGPHVYRYTKVGWDPGNTLVFEISDRDGKKETSKNVHYVRESWALSPDGKVLTQFRRTAHPGKPVIDQKFVFQKQ